jgi:hypothetical protein
MTFSTCSRVSIAAHMYSERDVFNKQIKNIVSGMELTSASGSLNTRSNPHPGSSRVWNILLRIIHDSVIRTRMIN